MDIVCIGAGVMASAFALSQRTHQVSMVASSYDKAIVSEIQKTGRDPRLDIDWDSGVQFFDQDNIDQIQKADLIVIGVSSHGISWAVRIVEQIFQQTSQSLPVLLLTKGLIIKGSDVSLIADEVANTLATDVFSITGPCIAKELAHQQPTQVELSGKNVELLPAIAEMISQPQHQYVVRVNQDYIGCQWASALKNVYAIIIAQSGDDQNLRSTRFADAIAEMANWTKAMGGNESTVYGLSGVGDLYVTCLGGRNGRLGSYLAQGMTVAEIIKGPMSGVTVEGLDLAYDLKDVAGSQDARMYQELLSDLSR